MSLDGGRGGRGSFERGVVCSSMPAHGSLPIASQSVQLVPPIHWRPLRQNAQGQNDCIYVQRRANRSEQSYRGNPKSTIDDRQQASRNSYSTSILPADNNPELRMASFLPACCPVAPNSGVGLRLPEPITGLR